MENKKLAVAGIVKAASVSVVALLSCYVTCSFGDNTVGLAKVASTVTASFTSIGELMAATAYLAGFGLTIAAIFKFKQHKDNPAQIPMGTPIAMLVIGICLIFLPGFIKPAGETIFGSSANDVAGGYTGQGALKMPGGNQ